MVNETKTKRNTEIYERFKKDERATDLAKEYNVKRQRIYQIVAFVEALNELSTAHPQK